MRLSDDKINELAHLIAEALEDDSRVTFKKGFNSVRIAIRQSIGKAMQKETMCDSKARRMIQSQKRNIAEGTSEWETLYFKYYEDELAKLHIVK